MASTGRLILVDDKLMDSLVSGLARRRRRTTQRPLRKLLCLLRAKINYTLLLHLNLIPRLHLQDAGAHNGVAGT